jgi:magnesium transporter
MEMIVSSETAYRRLIETFFEKDITAATRALEGMDEEEAAAVVQDLPPGLAVRVVKNLQISYAALLLERVEDPFLFQVVSLLETQTAAAILMHLADGTRQRISAQLSEKLKEQIRELLEYPEDSIGRLMTTDFLAFPKETSAEDAIEKIRSMAKKRFPASYAYVIDAEDRLVGVLNMRDLMIAPPEQPLEVICRKELFTLHCFTDSQEAAAELARRKYFAAPVVDSQNRILGIVKAERMLQGVQDDVTRDIQRMFGAGGDEKVFSPIAFSLRKRLPWLHINLATAFLAAAVVALFEGTIARITILAVFLPVVAGQGGNAGAQSLAVVMRGIVMREIPEGRRLDLVWKEAKLGAFNGVVIGVVTAGVAWLWQGNPYLGLVIGLGMFFNLIFAGISGSSIPLLMKRMGIDPAQSSSIILTTVTDVMGFLAFLGFAVLFQGFLVR